MGLKKKSSTAGDAGAETKGKKEKGGKSNLVPAIVVAAGLVLGGKMMGAGGGGSASATETTTAEAATTTTTAPGPVVTLDPITLNLSDKRFLKVGLALQLSAEHAEGGGGGHGEPADDDPTKGYARAIDVAIDVLGGKTMDALVAPGGREAAKHELGEHLHEAYHGEIEGVYFTEFVMQ